MSNPKPSSEEWYTIGNADDLFTPALILFPDRIEQNIRTMISIAGGADRLRPHVKTHKTAEVIGLQMKHGITKFKCATIAEAEMCAISGAGDILLASQPVGPGIERFFTLIQAYPECHISCIADNAGNIEHLSAMAVRKNIKASIWLDINNGMNRTGVIPGKKATDLYRLISKLPMLEAEGVHVYDGHIHESDPGIRKRICDESFRPVEIMINDLVKEGFPPVKIVAGGSPTFPLHARRERTELSPGTTLLWDHVYSSSFRDMHFLIAAVLIMRVISKPSDGFVCLDLGHKAVASEMPQPRVRIMGLKSYEITGHNEEHMVIRSPESLKYSTGDLFYAIPHHICPTVDRYDSVYVARAGKVTEEWKVAARRRKITI